MYDEDGNYTIELESLAAIDGSWRVRMWTGATMTSSTRLFEVNYDVSRDIMTLTILKVTELYAVPKPATGW